MLDVVYDHEIVSPCGGVYKGDAIEDENREGEFLPHGNGKMHWPPNGNDSGTVYVGQFTNGLKHGYGVLQHDGWKYTGMWAYDQRSGQGKTTYKNGSYVGEYLNGKKHGRGRYEIQDVENGCYKVLDGEWDSGKMHGYGEEHFASVTDIFKYKGAFVHGVKDGFGWFEWNGPTTAGWRYKGDVLENQPHGHGTFTKIAVKDGKNAYPTRVLSRSCCSVRFGRICQNMDHFVYHLDDVDLRRKYEEYNICGDVKFELTNVRNGLMTLAQWYGNKSSRESLRKTKLALRFFAKWCAQLIIADPANEKRLFAFFVKLRFPCFTIDQIAWLMLNLWREIKNPRQSGTTESSCNHLSLWTPSRIMFNIVGCIEKSETEISRNFWRSVAVRLLSRDVIELQQSQTPITFESYQQWVIYAAKVEALLKDTGKKLDFWSLTMQYLKNARSVGEDCLHIEYYARRAAARRRFDGAIRTVVVANRVIKAWMEDSVKTAYAPSSALQHYAHAIQRGDEAEIAHKSREYQAAVFERQVRRKLSPSAYAEIMDVVNAEVSAHERDLKGSSSAV